MTSKPIREVKEEKYSFPFFEVILTTFVILISALLFHMWSVENTHSRFCEDNNSNLLENRQIHFSCIKLVKNSNYAPWNGMKAGDLVKTCYFDKDGLFYEEVCTNA